MGILSKDARWPEKNGNSEIIPFAGFIWLFHQYPIPIQKWGGGGGASNLTSWCAKTTFTSCTGGLSSGLLLKWHKRERERDTHTHTHTGSSWLVPLLWEESYWNTPDSGVEKLLLLFWATSLGLTSWFCCREKKREKKEISINFTARQTVNKLLCTHTGCYAVVWPLLNRETGERVRQTWLKVCQVNWPLHYVGG